MMGKLSVLAVAGALVVAQGCSKPENKPAPTEQAAAPTTQESSGPPLVGHVLPPPPPPPTPPEIPAGQKHTTASGLTIIEVAPGEGTDTAQPGDHVWVEYTGKLQSNGEVFDSSVGKEPIDFTLGAGNVIKGWDEGVAGMKVNEKRQLIIPPSLGYGATGTGPIPGNATLVFDVKLIKIQKG